MKAEKGWRQQTRTNFTRHHRWSLESALDQLQCPVCRDDEHDNDDSHHDGPHISSLMYRPRLHLKLIKLINLNQHSQRSFNTNTQNSNNLDSSVTNLLQSESVSSQTEHDDQRGRVDSRVQTRWRTGKLARVTTDGAYQDNVGNTVAEIALRES